MKPNVKQKQPVVQLAINNALTGGGGGGGGDGYTKAEADAKFETITNAQSTYLAIADADEVPEVTSDDNGKVLTATYSEGTSSYAWATPAVPSVPSKKILTTKCTNKGSSWKPVTFTGLDSGDVIYFNGNDIWTDGNDTYCSIGNGHHYVLDKHTTHWSSVTFNGIPTADKNYFNPGYMFTDGKDIFCAFGNGSYKLNKETRTWASVTISDPNNIMIGIGWQSFLITLGGNLYYFNNSVYKFTENSGSYSWSSSTDLDTLKNNLSMVDATEIFSDGQSYYSLDAPAINLIYWDYTGNEATSEDSYLYLDFGAFSGPYNTDNFFTMNNKWYYLVNNYWVYELNIVYVQDGPAVMGYKRYTVDTNFNPQYLWTDGDNIYHTNKGNTTMYAPNYNMAI